MNILVLSWRDLKHPLAGGAEQVMNEHMRGWVKGGHSVTHFSSYFSGAKKEEKSNGVLLIREGRQFLGVQVAAILWYHFRDHSKFDLVVDEFHGWPFFTPLYVRTKKLAVIQELTKEIWFKYSLPFHINIILSPILYLIEPLFFLPYRNVNFLTASESTKKDLLRIGVKNKNITIIPHGIVLALPKPLPKKESKRTIIFLGALAKDKGIEDAIKTFALFKNKRDYNFWIVGKSDKNYLRKLKKLASTLQVKPEFIGYVTQEIKFRLLARAHLLINPSIREGWGLVNVEANSVGTPVVSYNSPGLVDSVKNGMSGVIVARNTPESLSQEILTLLENKDRYKDLQNGAIMWSNQFSWRVARNKSLMLVDSIVKSKV